MGYSPVRAMELQWSTGSWGLLKLGSSDGVLDWGLVALRAGDNVSVRGFHGSAALALAMHVEQLTKVKTRTLQDLDFVDEDVIEGVDGLGGLLDVLTDRVGDQLVDDLF